MTSTKKIAASRSNGTKSTGPKTEQGKKRARTNALRHGLAAIAPRDPATSAEIERLARWFCGDGATPERYEHARAIAEEHIILHTAARGGGVRRDHRARHEHGARRSRSTGSQIRCDRRPRNPQMCSSPSNSERARRVTRCPASTSQIGSLRAARTGASSTGHARFRCGLGSSSMRRQEPRGLSARAYKRCAAN
jgi:hypothetical protein